MHILFLTDNFPPEVNAPASRTFEHCRGWVRSGHQVTVITCAPNFPTGRIYEGYRNRFRQTEIMEGIRVVRVWSYITANEGFIMRILDYVSYMVSAIAAAPFVRGADLVIGTSPQFFTACAAYVVSRMKRIPFVFELRDMWPESIKAVGAMKDSAVIGLFEKIEMFLYRRAARIISVTESFKKTLIRRGIDGEKIRVVTNGVDASRFYPRPKDPELVAKYGLEDKFVVGYIGTHGMAHGLETILQTAKALGERGSSGRFHFMLVGEGAEKSNLVKMARELELKNMTFVDQVPKDEIARYWSILDLSIIQLRRTELFKTVIPSKIFESMGMGIPILLGVEGESARLVGDAGAGLVFEPDSPEDLTNKLIQLADNRELYEKCRQNAADSAKIYNRTVMAEKMLKILLSLVENGKEPSVRK
jgi:glycosyltransferase involved in cell wall biosynthesis